MVTTTMPKSSSTLSTGTQESATATMFRMAQIFQLRILSAAAIPAELFFSMSSKPLMTNQVA